MIDVEHLTLDFPTYKGPRRVLDDISFNVAPGEKIAILGRNGAGKTTLIKLIGGVIAPTSGVINRGMSISWPIGYAGGFHDNLTGRDNIRFIARLYDAPFDELYAFTEEFAELGDQLKMEVGSYSTGMKARLAFGLSLGIEFDCYLIDEVISAGDPKFQRKCAEELLEKRRDRALILASHDVSLISRYCTHALVMKGGRGKVFRDMKTALDIYAGL
jgi:capsular polysaccharide transport system ATP-binding protein